MEHVFILTPDGANTRQTSGQPSFVIVRFALIRWNIVNVSYHECCYLTLKMPRKPASENVVCLCHLLNILANFSNLFLHTGKQCGPWWGAVWSGSTLFTKQWLYNHKQVTKQTTIVVIGSLRVKGNGYSFRGRELCQDWFVLFWKGVYFLFRVDLFSEGPRCARNRKSLKLSPL